MSDSISTGWNIDQLAVKIRDGERRALAQGITLIESNRDDHRQLANELLTCVTPYTGNSKRIGISGVPGVGKSTFIEALGNQIINQSQRVAVLAIDPSSPISGGSILGDKTRMQTLSSNVNAFIRPSPSAGTLGGVTRDTQETLLLCEAAGFNVVLIETVGIGQSEVAVADMTDMFILLLLPGGGDELQGIKRGVIELADLVVVNKADGDMRAAASRSVAQYQSALQLLQSRTKGWEVAVQACSASLGEGINDVWETILRYHTLLAKDDSLTRRRSEQAKSRLWKQATETLMSSLKKHPGVQARVNMLEKQVMQQQLPTSVAVQELIDIFLKRLDSKTTRPDE